MGEEGESIENFLKWAAGLGITDLPLNNITTKNTTSSCLGSSLTVSHFPDAGGRGLGAVRDLKKGEMVLRVPKSALFTTMSLLQEDSFLSHAISVHSNTTSLSPSQVLMVCLLYEMSKAKLSRWYPYLTHLPRTYDLLLTFSEFEKQALQVEDAIWTAEKALSRARYEWEQALSLMKSLCLKPRFLTFKAWLWATSTISSRTMHVPWDEAGCLCPVGDFFNYAAPGDESSDNVDIPLSTGSTDDMAEEQSGAASLTDGRFNVGIAAYCFYARKNYKTGDQVLLSYGTYTNLELLEHYGFLLNKNPNDKVFIPLEPDMFVSTSWPKEYMYIHQNGRPSFALLCALRLRATPKSQQKSIRHLAYSGSQLSTENEVSVMTWISKTCQVLLNNLPTSIEKDDILLSAIDKIQNVHNPAELGKLLSTFKDEVYSFLEVNNLQDFRNGAEFPLSGKMKRELEKWSLAVQWRLRYKRTLIDCISYCKIASGAWT